MSRASSKKGNRRKVSFTFSQKFRIRQNVKLEALLVGVENLLLVGVNIIRAESQIGGY